MQATTTRDLSAAFVAAIHAITPTYAHARDEGWKYTPGGRERGGAEGLMGTALRAFELLFDPGVPGEILKGADGEDYVCRLRVATSYAAVPPDELEHLIQADAVDLRSVLMALVGTVPGLIQVHYLGVAAYDTDDQANALVEHAFRINWLQNTDAQ